MRTSLNNIKAIDDYLFGNLPPGDKLLFDANMLLKKDLVNDVADQQNTYTVIRQYSRLQLKNEIIVVQQILTTQPQHRGFMQQIANLFKKN